MRWHLTASFKQGEDMKYTKFEEMKWKKYSKGKLETQTNTDLRQVYNRRDIFS